MIKPNEGLPLNLDGYCRNKKMGCESQNWHMTGEGPKSIAKSGDAQEKERYVHIFGMHVRHGG